MPLLRDVLDALINSGFERLGVTRGGDSLGPPAVLAERAQPASTSR